MYTNKLTGWFIINIDNSYSDSHHRWQGWVDGAQNLSWFCPAKSGFSCEFTGQNHSRFCADIPRWFNRWLRLESRTMAYTKWPPLFFHCSKLRKGGEKGFLKPEFRAVNILVIEFLPGRTGTPVSSFYNVYNCSTPRCCFRCRSTSSRMTSEFCSIYACPKKDFLNPGTASCTRYSLAGLFNCYENTKSTKYAL